MTAVSATHTVTLRGEAALRRARAEILDAGQIVARSDWLQVPGGTSVEVTVSLTAEPGVYSARQATNYGSNIHEDIATIDLGPVTHPPS